MGRKIGPRRRCERLSARIRELAIAELAPPVQMIIFICLKPEATLGFNGVWVHEARRPGLLMNGNA